MCYEEIPCPRCSSLNIKKNGKSANNKQRYMCKDCNRQFIRHYTYRGCHTAVREMVVPMTLNSCGIRDITPVLKISPMTVLQIIRDAAAQVSEPLPPKHVTGLEMDEFWSFVKSKRQQLWCWYGWDRQRNKITAFVLGRRTDQSCQRLLDKHASCRVCTYHTDDWQSYSKSLGIRFIKVGPSALNAAILILGLASSACTAALSVSPSLLLCTMLC